MALRPKVINVDHVIETRNAQGHVEAVDHSHSGRFIAEIHYVDDANPNTVLFRHTFTFNHTDTVDAIVLQINNFGYQVSNARALALELSGFEGQLLDPVTAPPVEPEG